MHNVKNFGRKLNEFYSKDLGKIASWFIRQKLIEISDPSSKEKTLCYGFTQPYADLFENKETCLTPFRTSFEGEVVSEYDKFPIRDAQYDKIIAIHAVDHHNFPEEVISEFWRILEPEGKLILVVVNQNGFWKNSVCNETVGLAESYIKEALSFNKFFTEKIYPCLSFPPIKSLFLIKLLDFFGRIFIPSKSGILIFECKKKVFAPKGRTIKITPSLRELILKPKKVANRKDIA